MKRTKGVPYLVDCPITGSDVGTATKPCFPLRKLWEYTLIPAIAQLVDNGGPCENAIVVVQQDNAGPHIEANYSQWIRDHCDLLGWLYEPQAPQGWLNAQSYMYAYCLSRCMNDIYFYSMLLVTYRAIHQCFGFVPVPIHVTPAQCSSSATVQQ